MRDSSVSNMEGTSGITEKGNPEILIPFRHYLPGSKFGGSVRSIANLVDHLGDELNFKVLTYDRDIGDTRPYPGITKNRWRRLGRAKVYYLKYKRANFGTLKKLLRDSSYDLLYFNSFFAYPFTIIPLLLRKLNLIRRTPAIVAPRGEFTPGAFRIKRFKKRVYVALVKLIGLYDDVTWHASNEQEERDIRRWFGPKARVRIAPDLPTLIDPQEKLQRREKEAGKLKALFLSRVSPKKNLLGALQMLQLCPGPVEYNIYGPLEDRGYWEKCRAVIKNMPGNISVNYRGVVDFDGVNRIFREHDLFFFPTTGENFGHVILESLVNGCPVLISDQTPWRGLERRGVGRDIPLAQREQYLAVLQQFLEMDAAGHRDWSSRARRYGLQFYRSTEEIAQNRLLFRGALEKGRAHRSGGA